jgi:hypothetical protein
MGADAPGQHDDLAIAVALPAGKPKPRKTTSAPTASPASEVAHASACSVNIHVDVRRAVFSIANKPKIGDTPGDHDYSTAHHPTGVSPIFFRRPSRQIQYR